jgi:hypothetical protein
MQLIYNVKSKMFKFICSAQIFYILSVILEINACSFFSLVMKGVQTFYLAEIKIIEYINLCIHFILKSRFVFQSIILIFISFEYVFILFSNGQNTFQ